MTNNAIEAHVSELSEDELEQVSAGMGPVASIVVGLAANAIYDAIVKDGGGMTWLKEQAQKIT